VGLALRFQVPLRVQGRLRRRAAALLYGAALFLSLLSLTPAQAQSFTWGGTGSTTTTADYNLGTNWSNPPAGAPPVAAGQSAVFDTTGSTSVAVTASPVAPGSWTFNATAQSYAISGAGVNFSQAGTTGGIIDNANSLQTISISNNIGESVAGVQVQLQGASTLILSGTNTYTGGTKISGFGTLRATNSSSVGTGTVTFQDALFRAGAAGLTFSNNFQINSTPAGSGMDSNGYALTISGNITDGSGGAGRLTVNSSGGGAVILTGTNTYTGGTVVCSCGTLQLGTLATTGSIVGDVFNDGRLNIVNANTSGITSITTDFGGSMQVFGVNTFATPTITNQHGGKTEFFIQSNAGNATIVNRTGGLTAFNDASSAMNANITNMTSGGSTLFFGGSTAGNATITNNSSSGSFYPVGLGFFDGSTAGTAIIINNNHGLIAFGVPGGGDTASADHATITNNAGGHLQFDAFTTAGSATITTNSGGAVRLFDYSTGGNAQFITNGTGYVDFSGSLGPNGDGRIAAGSIAGSGFYYIGAGNTLVVGGNNLSTEVSGVIADFDPCGCFPGTGTLEKVGTGTLMLSGTNTYTGTTTVFGGVLDVEGSIASSSLTTVNANAALTGAGTVGNTVIANGGIFLPGNGAPGSFTTVAGNLAFQSGSLYLVQLNSVTSTFANVTGNATLAGIVGASFTPGSTVMKKYTILTAAGGYSGGFAGAGVIGAPGGLVAALSYDPTHAFLNFALDFGAIPGINVNQRNVGNGLTNFFNANGGIPLAFATLSPAGLSQVSGEAATGTQQATFNAMNLFLGLLTDPLIDGRGASGSPAGGATPFADEDDSTSAYAAKKRSVASDAFAKIPTKAEVARNNLLDPHWSVWGSAYGGGSTTDGNAALGSNSATARAFGFAAGADYRISPATLAGFALAGGGTNFSVNGFGTGRSDLFQAGAFVRHNRGAAYVTGALAYGWQDVTTDRTVTVAGIDRLHAQFNANAWSGRVEGGYRFVTPWMGVTPYAAGQFTTYSLPAYAEQVLSGAGTFALNYAAKDVTASRTELGVRTDRSFAMQNAILTLRGRAAWAHDFNTDRNISAVFQTLPGAAFIVGGAAQAHDSALTTASAEMKWLNGFSLAATFEGEFSDITTAYAGKGIARYTW
jgi:autotransporter-associated beta strand protein